MLRRLGSATLVVAALAPGTTAGAAARPASPPPLLAYSLASPKLNADGVVYLAHPDGTAPVRYGVGSFPRLSADGTQVAFTIGADGRRVTLVVGSTRGAARRRMLLPQRAQFDGWAGPDLVIQTPDAMLVRRPADPAWRTLLPAKIDGDRYPEFLGASPAGDDLLVQGVSQTESDLYVVQLDDGAISKLTESGTAFGGVWGPTGIAYGDAVPPGDIWLVQADGSGRHRVTSIAAGFLPIAFDESGDHLLAANPAQHNGRLWAVDMTTGAARALTPWVGDLFGQSISRDGKTVYAAEGCGGAVGGRGHLEAIPFAGGHPRWFALGACRGSWVP